MQKLHRNLLVMFMVLILSLSLSACGTPKVKHNDDPLWDEELEGANPEFVEDYIYMWDVLENEYPLLSTAERITGKDAESIKESYYYHINLFNNPQDFYNYVISPCLNEFIGTGHLGAIDDSFYEFMYSSFLKKPKILNEDTLCKYDYNQITRPQSKEFYGDVIEKVETYISEGGDIAESDTFISPSDNLCFEYYPEQSAAYVEIKQMNIYDSLDNPEYKALAEFFTKIEKKGYKNCIIDISHNGGGNSEYWVEGIVKPNLTETLSTKNYALIKGDMCRNYLGAEYVHPIDEFTSENLPKLNADDLSQSNYYVISEAQYTPDKNTKPLFTGEFWLLVGDMTYSSSEMMAVFCKDTGFATLVGTVTGGDGIGTDPMIVSLPNTGICFRFSSALGLNADGSGNEEFGTTPDYEISEGKDTLKKCLQLIEEGK